MHRQPRARRTTIGGISCDAFEQCDLHWHPLGDIVGGEFSKRESGAPAIFRKVTDNASLGITTSRPTDQCIFSRPNRASSPTAVKPSTSVRPPATSSSCRLPTPSSPRSRRRAPRSARRFPPCVSPISCSSRTTPRSICTARRSSPKPGSSSCACSAGSPTGPTGSSRLSRPAPATGATLAAAAGRRSARPGARRAFHRRRPRRIGASGTSCCTAARPTPGASSPMPRR